MRAFSGSSARIKFRRMRKCVATVSIQYAERKVPTLPMTSKDSHLNVALDELREARDVAIENNNRGTSMMLTSIIQDVTDLQERTNSIHGNENEA